jgi:hypothetical protein
MESYNKMVVMQMKQMSEDNQQLNYLKNKMVKIEQRSKAVEESLGGVSQKLRETTEENIFIRSKAKEKHLEYEQEVIRLPKWLYFLPMNMQESTIFFSSKSVSMALVTNDREFAVAVRVTLMCCISILM